jgi:heme/copper-type cytochrome/quinol oxidase subunit 4
MNLTPKTMKIIATLLIVIQVIAFIYMVKTTWRNDNEMPGAFFLIFILPLFSTILFRMAKKKTEMKKPE